MKILLVTAEHPGRLHGGLGHFIRVHTAGLRKSGHVVKLVFINLMHEDVQEAQETYPVDEVWNPLPSFPTGTQEGRILDSTSSLVWKAALLIKEFEPDVVHCNDRQTYLPFRYFPKVVYSKQLLITDLIGTQAMDSVWFEEMKIERLAVQQSAAVLIYSRFMVGRIHQTLAAKACPIVLPLGIDLDRYHSDKKPGKLKVAFFGRLEDVQKGFFEFLRAMEYLGKSYLEKNIDVSIFGRGDFPEIFDRSLYKFVGFLDGQDLKDAYAKTDVVIMPSRYEPFGFVGLEALASGCLLLAPEGLGMDEYYIPGINGVSIKNSPGDIATTLIKVIENWKEFLPLKTRAVETAKSWTWNRSAEFHARLYRNLLEPRNKAWNSCFSRSALLDREARPEIQEPVSQLLAWCQGLKFERILFIEPSEDLRVSLNGCWLIHSHHQDSYSDWSWLPFEEGSFDLVVAFGVLEYSSRVFSVLEEWRRISKALLLGILPEGLAPQRKGSFDMPEDGKFLAPEWSCESIELNWVMGKTWLLEKP